jgi:hypothetical protein
MHRQPATLTSDGEATKGRRSRQAAAAYAADGTAACSTGTASCTAAAHRYSMQLLAPAHCFACWQCCQPWQHCQQDSGIKVASNQMPLSRRAAEQNELAWLTLKLRHRARSRQVVHLASVYMPNSSLPLEDIDCAWEHLKGAV